VSRLCVSHVVWLPSVGSDLLLGSAWEVDLVGEGSRVVLSESVANSYHTQSICLHALFLVPIELTFMCFTFASGSQWMILNPYTTRKIVIGCALSAADHLEPLPDHISIVVHNLNCC
jgi:hypothetical protein